MSLSRLFHADSLEVGLDVSLSESASHHLARVLRAKINDSITVFNGQGGEYSAVITRIEKKYVVVSIKAFRDREAESPLEICLAQGISRGEKMDFTVQKAVELGVKKIIPLLTERSTVKLDLARSEKRLQHWQSIVIGACEQSGRNRVPEIVLPQSLESWLGTEVADYSFVLSPHVLSRQISSAPQTIKRVVLLVGPEGGLSEREMELAYKNSFLPLSLGPRVLRTETAGLAAITTLQCRLGDMDIS